MHKTVNLVLASEAEVAIDPSLIPNHEVKGLGSTFLDLTIALFEQPAFKAGYEQQKK